MKSILFYFTLVVSSALGQSATIAKLKFEQAEQAYVEGKYQESLDYIAEVETILKGTNTRTLYLKIVAQDKKNATLETSSFSDIAALRKNCDSYLKTTDGNVGLEDKFKEVYFISERLKKLPTNQLDFEKFKVQLAEKQQKEKIEQQRISIAGITIGTKYDQIPKTTWNHLDPVGTSYEKGNQIIADRSFAIHQIKPANDEISMLAGSLVGGTAPKTVQGGMFGSSTTTSAAPTQINNNVPTKTEVTAELASITQLWIDRTTLQVFTISQTIASGGKMEKESILLDFDTKLQQLKKDFEKTEVVITEDAQKKVGYRYETKIAQITLNDKYTYALTYMVFYMGKTVQVTLTGSLSEIKL